MLGSLDVRLGQVPVDIRPGIPRTILSLLLMRRGEVVSSDQLVDVVWGEQLPTNPANALQTQISYLRKRFASGSPVQLIVTRPGGYSLDVAASALDSWRFEQVVGAMSPLDHGDVAVARTAIDPLGAALGLWRGPAFADVVGHDFAVGETTRLEELRLVAIEVHNELSLTLGRHRELVAELARQVAEHPLRERLHHQLMLALYRSGRQAEALRAYAQARTVLVEQLGIEPGADLRELERRVLAQDRGLDSAPAPNVADVAASPTGETSTAPVPTAGRVSSEAQRQAEINARVDRSSIASDHGGVGHGRSRLPAAVSSLIGREVELERVSTLLARSRMVTLTGPGGAGKSRLAIETARRQEPAGCVWFVDLATVTDPGNVASMVGHGLGFTIAPDDDAAATVSGALTRSAGLLVLDTCEHVVEAVAGLVSQVLRDAPGVRVLATSRRPLNIAGEIAWPVPPLALAPPAALIGDLPGYASVALFNERAAAARPDFELTTENANDVVAICQTLDGLPLAIELAAARVDVLSPRAIRARLEQRFDLLTDGDRDAAPRQRTLRGAIEWSVGLLDDAERTFFARLGVFTGTFDLAAAVAVTGESELAALDLLTSLVRQSMVSPLEHDRYRLLDSLQAYAADMLQQIDADATCERHALYYLTKCQRAGRGICGSDQPLWLDELRADRPNLARTFEWFLATGNGVAAARLVGSLRWFYTLDGTLIDGERQMRRVLEIRDLPALDRARVLGGLALLSASLRQVEAAEALARDGLALAREAGDRAETAFALNMLGLAQAAFGDFAGSERSLADAGRLSKAAGDQWGGAVSLVLATRNAIEQPGRPVGDLASRAYEAARALGDTHLIAVALRHMGYAQLRAGDPLEAEQWSIRALDQAESIDSTEGILGALHVLGLALEASGKFDIARLIHRRALALAFRAGHVASQCEAVEGLARLAHAEQRADEATRLVSIVEARRQTDELTRRRDETNLLGPIPRNHAAAVTAGFDELVDELLRTAPVDFVISDLAPTPTPTPPQIETAASGVGLAERSVSASGV